MRFDKQTIKTVIVIALVCLALFAAWQGVQAVKRGDQPGRQAAAYLDALIRLGKMPSGVQIDAWISEAAAKAKPAATAEAPKPAPTK